MTLKVIFYKAPGKFIDKAVRWWTKSPYSHCEIMINSNLCFTADAWENRVRYANFTPNPEKWDFVDVELTTAQFLKLQAFCDSKNGAKYDWRGILSFILPFLGNASDKWFCSEVCLSALQAAGLYTVANPSEITPGKLYEVLT